MSSKRIEKLLKALTNSGLDAVVINPGSTLTYLTGLNYHLMERPVVLIVKSGKKPVMVLPVLEVSKLRYSTIDIEPISYGDNPATWQSAFDQAVKMLDIHTDHIGVEPTRLRVLELRFLQTALPRATFEPSAALFGSLRIEKDEQEIEMMRKAAVIAEKALLATLPLAKPGVTERDLAAELTLQLLRHGSDAELPFTPIVAGGPNSADPHAAPGEREIRTGDLLLFDWGASYHGYASDITRTFAIGHIDAELRKIVEITIQANAAARAAARPGIFAGDVDRAARNVIEAAGFGAEFFHRTGHGLGMEAHEEPYIFGENEHILTPGNVFTIEPGIYLQNYGGVRVEDNVVITANGSESLTTLPRELVEL